MAEKTKVSDILIERFLEDVDTTGVMPWQKPYKCARDAFNWLTLKPYRGINRLLLPVGEYMTKNQLNEYNKKHGEDFKFQKGIKWFPVCYFNVEEKEVTAEEILKIEGVKPQDLKTPGFICQHYSWQYYLVEGEYIKRRSTLKYYRVADIKWFQNSKGEHLPSRLGDGTIELESSKPAEVYENYIKSSGVEVIETVGVPCYSPYWDRVELNPRHRSEASYWSTAFHELVHSTGYVSRLNRLSIASKESEEYAKEECVAEIASYLLCCECGIEDFQTSGLAEYENQVAYVQSWKKRVSDWGSTFVWVCSQADRAFSYIMGDTEEEE